jgi:hypothetical protein
MTLSVPIDVEATTLPTTAHSHGLLKKYTESELRQIAKLKEAGMIRQNADTNFWVEMVRTKLMLDSEDAAEGRKPGKGRGSVKSRFTKGLLDGDFGDYAQQVLGMPDPDSGKRWTPTNSTTFCRWLTCADAASELVVFGPPTGGPKLPPADALLRAVNELEIAYTTLERYANADPVTRELSQLTLKHQGQLRTDFILELRKLAVDYPQLVDEAKEGIALKTLKVPTDLKRMMERARTLKAAEEAAEQARQAALEAAAAEALTTLPASTLQEAADQRAQEEVEEQVRQRTGEQPVSDAERPLTTYPVLECIDPDHQTPAYDELRKQFKADTEEFLTDMRTAYKAMRDLRDILKKWGDRLQNEHLKLHQNQMLVWETWSECWNRLNKFSKLGNVHHVKELMDLFEKILNEAKHGINVTRAYCKLDTKKYREFVIAETAADHWQPGRKAPMGGQSNGE